MRFASSQHPFAPMSARELRKLSRQRQTNHSIESERQAEFALAASFTSNSLETYIEGYANHIGLAPFKINAAEFNQVVSAAASFDLHFDAHKTVVACFLFRLEDLATSGRVKDCADVFATYFLPALERLANHFEGQLILSLPPRPAFTETIAEGLAGFSETSQIWHEVCLGLGTLAKTFEKVSLVDLDDLMSEFGQTDSLDPRSWMMYRNPFSDKFSIYLAGQIIRALAASTRPAKKCLVLDCDNTLWGGVIGEDGMSGIALSDEFPGRAFVEFQKTCKVLRDSGIFLAVSSKNDLETVLDVFETHPAMVLKRDDIAVFAVDWNEKSTNIRQIAESLNIGTDAIVFVDDSDYELTEVATHLPEVTCLKVPEEIAYLPQLLIERRDLFDRQIVTEDDKQRSDRMQQEASRKQAQAVADPAMSHEGLLATMGLEVAVYTPRSTENARVTQLINKTNQFNLTTRRYGQPEVDAFCSQDDVWCYALNTRDKFGEYGLVGVCIVRLEPSGPRIDIFLMSCRVLNRGVETALLACAADDLASQGHQCLRGDYIPSQKNGMCRNFFTEHGFTEHPSESSNTLQSYVLNLKERPAAPAYLSVIRQPFDIQTSIESP